MSDPMYVDRAELEALIAELDDGSGLDFHWDPRSSHLSYHYTLTRDSDGLKVSCWAENHDVNGGYDGSEDYSDRPITVADAVAMLAGMELE